MADFLGAQAIRELFVNFFNKQGHETVPGSSLIPAGDPTLLFTNAGMVQFKSVFLGTESRACCRAVSIQPCMRAGGKHNDLERVGYTARHHTFFEMLGNFSFGEYFKQEAIHFAWDFLTGCLHLPPEKLWVTVYQDDTEAEQIWLKDIGVSPARFSRLGEDSNFWSMGATGPCGPCTEIFYDHGPHVAGGPPGSPEEDGDRYVEIWNLVFMQYNRDAEGHMTPLPKPSVDTGMGLERIAAVKQGVYNNYDTDLFQPLVRFTAALADTPDLSHPSLRVIADHIRAAVFLIAEGMLPSSEGRGYVLRRIIRRALRHGAKLGLTAPFFWRLTQPLTDCMGEAYPFLVQTVKQTENILKQEEEQFGLTLSLGMKLFEEAVAGLSDTILPGEMVFRLYDTFGFPADLTADMARERGLLIDENGFEQAMAKQRERSRETGQFEAGQLITADGLPPAVFTGDRHHLEQTITEKSIVTAIFVNGQPVNSLQENQTGIVLLNRTPFYAESGGQVGDQGFLQQGDKLFRVQDTRKQGDAWLHTGIMEKGSLQLRDSVHAEVDIVRRRATVLNHTATHLLHHALRKVLGTHVVQKGSLVEPERLRFDFSHSAPLSAKEMAAIEQEVNAAIRSAHAAKVKVTTPEKAMAEGALALFGEKYGEQVRMVRFGDSLELCGGTHAHNTGEVGLFLITSESGIAAGIRRMEAVTGEGALNWVRQREADDLQKMRNLEDRVRALEKQLQQVDEKLAAGKSQALVSRIKKISGVSILTEKIDATDSRALRTMVDQLKSQVDPAVILLATVRDNRVSLIAGVTKTLSRHLKAGEIVNHAAGLVGGRGGGRPELAEAGGGDPAKLESALTETLAWIEQKLQQSL